MTPTPSLVEHFFRHEHGRLVAMLSNRVGVQHIEAIEDAVQSALLKALETWTVSGLPDNPSAWVYKVANNQLMSEFRQHTNQRKILERYRDDVVSTPETNPAHLVPETVEDDLLRMLFV